MQITAAATRISNQAKTGNATQTRTTGQLVVDDFRLRGWALTAAGGAWAAPTTDYQIVDTASGDYVLKTGFSPIASWTLGYQDLGHNTPVTLPDSTTGTPYISSIAISASKDLICWYANRPRNGWKAGIYTQIVENDGVNFYWSHPYEVWANAEIDDANEQSQFFITFPRLQTINSEYWILALECSLQSTIITYHLCYFRSKDGINWSDREYLAGVSGDENQALVGINQYDDGGTPTSFVLDDLKHAYLSVSGNNTYIISNGGLGNFVCGSTSLVGITNPSKQLDVTALVDQRALSQSAAPTAAQGKYTIKNVAKQLNSNAVLVAGARLIHKAGYVTSGGNDLITISTELLDEIRQPTNINKNEISLTTTDYTGWLRDWNSDLFWEWFSPRQSTYELFCDTSGLSVQNGGFVIGSDAILSAYPVDANAPSPDDMAFINDRRTTDGSMELQWKITQTLSGHYAGVVFQGVDNANYYVVIYNGDTDKYELKLATPSTTAYKYLTYGAALQSSSTQSLAADTAYWLKVMQWHNHVIAWHSTDRGTWTKVIDYTGVTANLAYWGVVGRSTGSQSGSLGNTNGSAGATLMDNSGNPKYWARRFQTGANPSILRALTILAGQKATPDKLNIGIAKDNGSGTAPADITTPSNVLWASSIASNQFGDPSTPNWSSVQPDIQIALSASTYYWVFFYFNSALTGGQEWDWFGSGATGNSVSSTTSGASWSAISGNDIAVAAFVTYELGAAKFLAMYFTSGEYPNTIEDIAKAVAAKAWVLDTTVSDFVSNGDLTFDAGSGAYWQPASFGKLGDCVVEVDIDNFTSTNWFEIDMRSSAIGFAGTYNYLNISADTQTWVYSSADFLTYYDNIASLVTLPTAFHLRVVYWTNYIYVYVNDVLAALFYDPSLSNYTGYCGIYLGGATYSNYRVPDMTAIKEYYSLDAERSALNALEDLTAKVQQQKRYTFFIRYDGSLYIGSFPRRSSVGTYSATLEEGEKVDTVRYSISHLVPQGDYYAARFDADELDRRGRRHYKREDYTDARSNAEAYSAGALVLQKVKELGNEYSISMMPADFALEREDRITVVNPLDGTSQDFIINDIDYQGSIGQSTMKVGLRKFIA